MDKIRLLKELIAIPSMSREETACADHLQMRMKELGLDVHRKGNNLWVESEAVSDKPTIMLNAHIDTVKPVNGYTNDPFTPIERDGAIFGLGSNDDGASLVALLDTYLHLAGTSQSYRLVFSATSEEEVCGRDGIESIFDELGPIALGIMGEPTGMQMAVAERGLMVLDCKAIGKSGHAARNEGVNAIYKALESIEWFRTHEFDRVSDFIGKVKMSVTMINAGSQHNVVPDHCDFVVDVRNNGMYSNVELLGLIKKSVTCEVKERSTRLDGSHISMDHPFVRKGLEMGLEAFGSPTTSNQAVSRFTTIKIGPGQSSRSHTADEFVMISEVEEAVGVFVGLLDGLIL